MSAGSSVCVIGLGKIGLPLAVQIASSGFRVVGFDVAEDVVKQTNAGVPPFPNEPNLGERLREVIDSGRFSATTLPDESISRADILIICTPLALKDGSTAPDYSILDQVAHTVGSFSKDECLVILETTVPVGTTRTRLMPNIIKHRGVDGARGLQVAFSPERVSSGSVFRDLAAYPKLVGGVDKDSAESAARFYGDALQFAPRDDLTRPNAVWTLESSEDAEMVKLCETTYRDVNIALANEFAKHCVDHGLDFGQIREAANSQPFSYIHDAGVSVGGHCIPVYPHLYMEADRKTELVPRAREINNGMPEYAVETLERRVGSLKNALILIAGVAYRPLVRETANSGAFDLANALESRGAKAYALDPMFTDTELQTLGFETLADLSEVDHVIVHTYHPELKSWTPSDLPKCKTILFGRKGDLFALPGIQSYSLFEPA
ncbi:nucleotide sugar dehydrogenase [Aquiluna sp.]|nr:nucleotide sugar dehydrogenase [Aquiluna sp.]